MRELQAQLERLQKVPASTTAAAEDTAAEQVPNPADLRDNLTGGLYHCLYWLFGLELPGLDTQEAWGGNFQVGGSACVCSGSLLFVAWLRSLLLAQRPVGATVLLMSTGPLAMLS